MLRKYMKMQMTFFGSTFNLLHFSRLIKITEFEGRLKCLGLRNDKTNYFCILMHFFWSFHISEWLIALSTFYPILKRKLTAHYQDSKVHLDSSHLMNSNLSADVTSVFHRPRGRGLIKASWLQLFLFLLMFLLKTCLSPQRPFCKPKGGDLQLRLPNT